MLMRWARICACYIVRLLFDNFLEIEMAKRGFMALEEVAIVGSL